jgi:hypothetical protein
LSRYLYVILGSLELIFLVALSVVGEREFICEFSFMNSDFGIQIISFGGIAAKLKIKIMLGPSRDIFIRPKFIVVKIKLPSTHLGDLCPDMPLFSSEISVAHIFFLPIF